MDQNISVHPGSGGASGLNGSSVLKTSLTKITIIIPTDAYFLSGIRDFTLSLTRNMTGFSDQEAYRFQSVVDELCNNAIEHGSAKGQEIKIVFSSVGGEYINIEVEDTGTGLVKKTAAEMTQLVAERRNPGYLQHLGIRGRGLAQIVASWTDELEFKDRTEGGLIVRAKKYLHVPENQQNVLQKNPALNVVKQPTS